MVILASRRSMARRKHCGALPGASRFAVDQSMVSASAARRGGAFGSGSVGDCLQLSGRCGHSLDIQSPIRSDRYPMAPVARRGGRRAAACRRCRRASCTWVESIVLACDSCSRPLGSCLRRGYGTALCDVIGLVATAPAASGRNSSGGGRCCRLALGSIPSCDGSTTTCNPAHTTILQGTHCSCRHAARSAPALKLRRVAKHATRSIR